jgi:hypothetical protein
MFSTLSGCVGTRTFRPYDAAFIDQNIDGRSATLAFRGGRSVRATALRVDADSVSWVDRVTGRHEVAPLADIASLTVRSPHLSAGAGLRSGALIGAVVGGVAGAVGGYHTGVCYFWCPPPTGTERIKGALLFSGAGVLSGAAVGGVAGIAAGAAFAGDWELVPDLPSAQLNRPSTPLPF